MKKLILPLSLALAFPGLGSAQTAAPVSQQTQEQRLALLERRVASMSEMLLQLDRLQQEMRQLRGEVEVQKHSMDALNKRQRDLYLDIDRRLGQLTAAPSVAVGPQAVPDQSASPPAAPRPFEAAPPAAAPAVGQGPGAAAPGDPALEKDQYQQAFNLLMQRRYEEAKRGFQDFLGRYPGGDLAANAQYWLAEASYVNRDFKAALFDFSRVVRQYPSSPKVKDAHLKIGYIHYEQQEWAQARQSLEMVTKNYPDSTAAQLAQKRLDQMRTAGH